jgi:transposase
MSKSERRQFTAEQKAEIVRRHLVDRVAVSDLCDQYKIAPSMLYAWQKQVLDAMAQTLEHGSRRNGQRESARLSQAEHKVAALEARLAKKDAVIAEISAEYVQLKKELGEI